MVSTLGQVKELLEERIAHMKEDVRQILEQMRIGEVEHNYQHLMNIHVRINECYQILRKITDGP